MHALTTRTIAALALGGLMTLGPLAAEARSTRISQDLGATGADDDASGEVKILIRDSSKGLRGQMEVKARRLEPERRYEIEIEGVRIGSLTTRRNGSGKAKFDSKPKPGKQLLGVDPRGKLAELLSGQGATVLQTAVSASTLDPSKVRCCLPDDSGPDCEDRTAAECSAAGGIDLGPGSCLPNPCSGPPPPEPEDDIACCLPDDSGPECEDRTPAECSAQGGINIGAAVCLPNPCSGPTPPPDDDIRCCLPDDSGPECEDRTVAECATLGGVNIGAGACLPDNPCLAGATTTTTTLPGATTTTTLPAPAAVVVTCERRADRSRASVNGNNLASGTYRARVTSGANTATSGLAPTVGDEVQLDFDSDPTDIAAGATAIAASFIQGAPPQVTGEILDAGGAVVVSATVTCLDR
jgi:hypothetical protein